MKKLFVCLIMICYAITAYASDFDQEVLTKQDTIKANNRLIADITNDPDKPEERLVAQLGTFQQGIADLDDYNITLFERQLTKRIACKCISYSRLLGIIE